MRITPFPSIASAAFSTRFIAICWIWVGSASTGGLLIQPQFQPDRLRNRGVNQVQNLRYRLGDKKALCRENLAFAGVGAPQQPKIASFGRAKPRLQRFAG